MTYKAYGLVSLTYRVCLPSKGVALELNFNSTGTINPWIHWHQFTSCSSSEIRAADFIPRWLRLNLHYYCWHCLCVAADRGVSLPVPVSVKLQHVIFLLTSMLRKSELQGMQFRCIASCAPISWTGFPRGIESIEFQNRSSRPWRSIEFRKNVH